MAKKIMSKKIIYSNEMKDTIGSLGMVLTSGTVALDLWLDLSVYVLIPMLIIGIYLSSFHLHGLYQIWKSRKNN